MLRPALSAIWDDAILDHNSAYACKWPAQGWNQGLGEIWMSEKHPWLANYPAGVPAEVDLEEFRSIVSVLESSCLRLRDSSAFENLERTTTYAAIDELRVRLGA